MIGLYRPLMQNIPKELLAEVRAGRKEPREILEPNTMGVGVLKHRYYGNREGQRTALRLEHGRLHEIPERDQYTTAYGGSRI
jgi:hypothetical protein